jgi:hypothetical protein
MVELNVVIRNGEIVTADGSIGCADIGIVEGIADHRRPLFA